MRQDKHTGALVTVATNLYLHTVPEAEDAPVLLQFSLPDSRYRYLIFCLSAVLTAILVYDEEKDFQPEVLFEGCPHFVTLIATKDAQEYFRDLEFSLLSDPLSSQDALNNAKDYFMEFFKHWWPWPDLEKEDKGLEQIDLICSMIHTTESNVPADKRDLQRLGELGLWINCQMPIMREAFIALINR
jgi:hypothetical protein